MKQFIKKITSTLLALLVLFSTFSFTVEKHYCGDFLVDVSYFGNAEGCGMEMKPNQKKKNCCKDEVQKIQGQNQLQQAIAVDFGFEKQQFLTAFIISYEDIFRENESKKVIVIKEFPPPDLNRDFQVLYQTFLI